MSPSTATKNTGHNQTTHCHHWTTNPPLNQYPQPNQHPPPNQHRPSKQNQPLKNSVLSKKKSRSQGQCQSPLFKNSILNKQKQTKLPPTLFITPKTHKHVSYPISPCHPHYHFSSSYLNLNRLKLSLEAPIPLIPIQIQHNLPRWPLRLSLPHLYKTPRPNYFLIFFDATQLYDKSELQPKSLHFKFSLLALSFISNNPNPNLFFWGIEFKESQQSFALFGINALPFIRLATLHQSSKESDQMD